LHPILIKEYECGNIWLTLVLFLRKGIELFSKDQKGIELEEIK